MKKYIDAELLYKEIEKEKLATIRAMNDLANNGIKIILPQHYDKIGKMVENSPSEKLYTKDELYQIAYDGAANFYGSDYPLEHDQFTSWFKDNVK